MTKKTKIVAGMFLVGSLLFKGCGETVTRIEQEDCHLRHTPNEQCENCGVVPTAPCADPIGCSVTTSNKVAEQVALLEQRCDDSGCTGLSASMDVSYSREKYEKILIDSWYERNGALHSAKDSVAYYYSIGGYYPCFNDADHQKAKAASLKFQDERHGIYN